MRPAIHNHLLSSFIGTHDSVREACMTFFAQSRAMGVTVAPTVTLYKLEELLRQEYTKGVGDKTWLRENYRWVKGAITAAKEGSASTMRQLVAVKGL